MSSRPPGSRAVPANPPTGDRLESWKEIAAYFDRTVRTVQLWEQKHGMPVHRPAHGTRGVVYAYRSELDAWFGNGRSAPTPRAPSRRARSVRMTVAASLAVVLVGLAVWLGPTRLDPGGEDGAGVPHEGLVLRQSPGPERYMDLGHPGADRRYLPYTAVNGELALFEMATGETRRLAGQPGGYASAPVLSPDNRRVAYLWHRYSDGQQDLRVVGSDGSEERVLLEEARQIRFFDWAEDGDRLRLVAAAGSGRTELSWISPEDGSAEVFATLERSVAHGVRLSPDGRDLVYARPAPDPESPRDIFLMRVADGTEVPLVQHPADDLTPLWTLDGSGIVFASDRAGTVGVWALSIRDGRPLGATRLVRKDLGRSQLRSLTRDGSLYYSFQAGMKELFVAGLDAETSRVEEPPAVVGERFFGASVVGDWSPSGRYLAYVSERGYVPAAPGYRKLVLFDTTTGTERVLSPRLGLFRTTRWLDERTVVVGSLAHRGLFRIDLDSGGVTQVASGSFLFFDVTPHARAVVVLDRGRILRRELESGRVEELYGPDDVNSIALSPDGERLAFSTSLALFTMPATGGAPRRVREFDDGRVAVQAWTRDGRALLVHRGRPPEGGDAGAELDWSLWRVPLDGGSPRELSLSLPNMGGFRVHPDGRRIAFTAGVGAEELWVMENLLPARR